MGRNTDKLYITHSEWSSSDAYSANVGSNAGARAAQRNGAVSAAGFRRLPFNFCAASLQPFRNPVCTADGTIFDVEVISAWLEKHGTNPVTGEPLAAKDLIKLNFARNGDHDAAGADGKGELIDPLTFKVFTDNTHIVAIRHGSHANVFAWDTVERMNIKPKMWRDLVTDEEFERKDIITLQDPHDVAGRDLGRFQHLQKGGTGALLTPAQEEERRAGSVNIEALGRIGEKVLRAKDTVERARRERERVGGDVNHASSAAAAAASNSSRAGSNNGSTTALSRPKRQYDMIQEKKKLAPNAAAYTTGRAAASFTSTGLTPETSGERALLSDEEWMLQPRRVKIKGFARLETSLGDLTVELHTDTAPRAVWNFVRLAQKGYYRDVAFHRNIRNFMIQGGDPTGTGRGGASIWGRDFADELEGPHLHSVRGVMSMANKGRNTNSSQFFVTYRAAPHLDRKHTVFGRVVEGLDVLDRMEAAPTDDDNRPHDPIVIRDVVVLVDPFAEFLKERDRQDRDAARREEVRRAGGAEDDNVTWTGKRVRNGGGGGGGEGGSDSAAGVGKYLKATTAAAAKQREDVEEAAGDVAEAEETWEEPSRKKVRTGGFGNFDGW